VKKRKKTTTVTAARARVRETKKRDKKDQGNYTTCSIHDSIAGK
jgi:hypothetical protein